MPRRDEKDEVHPWNDKTYQDLRKMVEALPPGRLHDQALDRIRSLDCANPDPTLSSCDPNSSVSPPAEAAKWQKALQDARADDSDYPKALAAELKALVCSGGGNAAYVLRGLLSQNFSPGLSRLDATGTEAPTLVDFIMSKDCPVSASLTDDDKRHLLHIKQNASEKPGG